MKIPLFSGTIKAGFPAPSDDYISMYLDIDEHLISNPNSTFFVKVSGDSMSNDGILPDDILVVDKSISNYKNKIIVAFYNNEFCVKRYINSKLVSSNPTYPPIVIGNEDELFVWGVVIGSFRKYI